MIEISMSDTAVLLHIVESLSGPLDDTTYVMILREARFVFPKLIEAIEKAGIDVDELNCKKPEIPLLTPGSKHSA